MHLLWYHGPLTKYVNCGLRMRRECRERFPRHRLQRKPLVKDPDMHHARTVMHVGIVNPRWRGKRSRHSRRMRHPQYYVSGKKPVNKTGHIHLYTTKHRYEIKFNICCQSSNLVYCIYSNTCGRQYIGQTKRKLLERHREHCNNIRKNHQNDPIGRHFNTTGHSGDIKQITTCILASVTLPGDSNGAFQMCLKFDWHWIFELRHRSPMVSTPRVDWICLLFCLLPNISR